MGEWSENLGFIGRLFVLGFFFRLHGSHDCFTQSGTTHGMDAEFDFPMGKLGLAFAIVGFSDGENVGVSMTAPLAVIAPQVKAPFVVFAVLV